VLVADLIALATDSIEQVYRLRFDTNRVAKRKDRALVCPLPA